LLDFWKRVKQQLIELDDRPQSWLEAQAGIGHSTMSTWIGEDRYPGVDKAHAIARALGVSIDWLMTGETPTHNDPDVDAIHRTIAGFTQDELIMAKGVLQTILYQRLNPASSDVGINQASDAQRERIG